MIACLYGASPRLAALADQFSPMVETVAADTVVFSVDGLGSLFGNFHEIASEISKRGAEMHVQASLAIASNKSTAILIARSYRGIHIIAPGHEGDALSGISIDTPLITPEMLIKLHRWGVRTLGELAALPEIGVVERLGEAGYQLRRVALGQVTDLLHLSLPPVEYTLYQEFDDALELLEPILFIVSGQLHDLTAKLMGNGKAARRIIVTLTLVNGANFVRLLDLPLAMRDPLALLKQVQLSLEAKPPDAPITAVQVTLDPVDPRFTQGGLFHPAAPEPEKLQTLLSRLRALAGADRVGTPELLNTHRPDAYRLRPCAFEPAEPVVAKSRPLRVALRYFRPPVAAQVSTRNQTPKRVTSERVRGDVIHSAGPWRSSGDWWADTSWVRDEWDVVLEDRAVYRIYLTDAERWFLQGSYD
jgi:protein ImuB